MAANVSPGFTSGFGGASGSACGQMSAHPFDDKAAHLGSFLVGAIEEVNAAILLAAILPVKRQQMIANLLDPGGRREGILAAVDAEVRPRNDQLVDGGGIELSQQ